MPRFIPFGFVCLLTGSVTAGLVAAAQKGDAKAQTVDKSAEHNVVSGVVLHPDGTPQPGAKVVLLGRKLYRAESDEQGRFRFEEIPAGAYHLWARRDNLISERKLWRVAERASSPREDQTPLRLTMTEGKQADFTVTSAVTGKPLADATIRLGYPDRRTATTAADGAATIVGLLSEKYEVIVEAEGHARALLHLDLAQSDRIAEVAVPLAAGGVMEGVVTDESGEPLSGVGVGFHVPGMGGHLYGDARTTDEAGRFRHRFLPLDTGFAVSFSKEEYLVPERQEIALSAARPKQQLEIRLKRRPPGGSVRGVVKDTHGKPIAGASVSNSGNTYGQERSATTGDDGAFVLHDLLKSYTGHEIIVRAKGFAPLQQVVEPGPASAPATVDVVLQPGHFIKGRVVNEQGEPIEEATVAANGLRLQGRIGDHVRTAADGSFQLDSLPESSRFDVYGAGYSGVRGVTLALDSPEPVIVTLEPTGVVRGRVVDADSGKPITQFRVRFGFSRQRLPSDADASYPSTLGEGIAVRSAEGQFLFDELNNRMALEITVEAEGYERALLPRVVTAPRDAAVEVEAALKRFDPTQTFTLEGRLVDHAGKGVPDAQLRLIVSTEPPKGYNDNQFNWILVKTGQLAQRGHCDQFLQMVSDAKGGFQFRNVLPGKHLQLAFWGKNTIQGRSLAFDKTSAGATQTVTIQLPKPASATVTIDLAKFPNAGRIRLSRPQEAWHDYEQELTKDKARLEFGNLPPGEYSVVVQSKPVRVAGTDGEFRLEGLAQQRFMLEEGGTKTIHFGEP